LVLFKVNDLGFTVVQGQWHLGRGNTKLDHNTQYSTSNRAKHLYW